MERYHKKVHFPVEDSNRLESFTDSLNSGSLNYSSHCLDNIKHRAIDLEGVLLFIKNSLKFDCGQIFEYYKAEGDIIEKVCYRANYGGFIDLILVIGKGRKIVTIYLNSAEDNHETLNNQLYKSGV